VLRELVDNALDAGSDATIEQVGDAWVIADNGPGLDPADIPRLFSVNRPLLSSKRRRLPLRGMLGNGLRVVAGAVAASEGSLTVETRGHRLTLATNPADGLTEITDDQPIPTVPGLVVRILLGPALPRYNWDDSALARTAIALSHHGTQYQGPSSPWWYSAKDLHHLMQQVTPADTSVARLCRELGFTVDDDRSARDLSRDDAAAILAQLRASAAPVKPERLGSIGRGAYGDTCYAASHGFVRSRDTGIPYLVETWATCRRSEKRGGGDLSLHLLLNRTPSAARISGYSDSDGLHIRGCGLIRSVKATI
jgi:hypothetical protein